MSKWALVVAASSFARFIRLCVHQLRLFFIALQFFTRLPIPLWVGFESSWLSHAARYFPAVGIVVGAVTASVYVLSIWVWPQPVAVLLSTIAGIYLTGAFHEDGFADVCDGLGGGRTPERALEIMKDSHIGAFGVIGIGLILALKCITLSSLPVHSVAIALLAAHPLSRLASAALIWRLSYVRADGKAKLLAQHMSTQEFCIAVVTASLPVIAICVAGLLPWQAILISSIAMVIAMLWLAGIFLRRIGGYTGDCLGAVQQITEVLFYLGLLAAITL